MTKFGKYKAIVVDIKDPLKCGRIRVYNPEIFGANTSAWCTPNMSLGDFQLPKIEDTVWIEFEQGNISYPIYSGTWFQPEETPVEDNYTQAPNVRVISFGDVKFVMGDTIKLIVGDKVLDFNDTMIDKLIEYTPVTSGNHFIVQEE